MSEHHSGRRSAETPIESDREVADEAPVSGTVLLDDDPNQAVATGSNGIRFGQEGN